MLLGTSVALRTLVEISNNYRIIQRYLWGTIINVVFDVKIVKKDDVWHTDLCRRKIDLEFLEEFISEVCSNVKLPLETELETRCHGWINHYRRRWGWRLCDDQWNGIAEVSTLIEVSRSSPEAGNGKRGGNWKCDGRRSTGERDGNPDIGVKVEIYGNYESRVRGHMHGLTCYHGY